MISKSFKFLEPNTPTLTTNSFFYISSETKALPVLFRVLGGSCDIYNINEEESIECISNYFYNDYRLNTSRSIDFLDDIEEIITCEDYEIIIRNNHFKNISFFKALLNEISACIYYENNKKHTAAFVHLYRAYESISYAFPMIYAAKTDNYYGTFDNLRKWLCNSDDTGELRFHRNFIMTLFNGTPELSSTIDINILSKEEYKESIFDSLETKVLNWSKPESRTPNSIYPEKICVPFSSYHDLIVTLRNRYFHYMSTRKDNITLDDILDPELIFSLVNRPSLYFIASVFNAIVTHQYK